MVTVRQQIHDHLQKRVDYFVSNSRNKLVSCEKTEKKIQTVKNRKAEIIKVHAEGIIDQVLPRKDEMEDVVYHVHLQYLIRQNKQLYMEEEVEYRKAEFYKGIIVDDYELDPFSPHEEKFPAIPVSNQMEAEERDIRDVRVTYHYDRRKAVQYAERWWNDYNPAFKKFDVDCTNYISQCLHAGGAPMRGYPNRGKGWWMQNNNWSYSWSVAHSFRWYLSNSTAGLRAKEVSSPEHLLLGDVICYDFQGDGRFDHTTIVTGKDAAGMPLVNAHTTNSRMRYWAYEDSTAYTPNIQYKFFTIIDDE